MKSIRSDLLKCFSEFSHNDEQLIRELGHLATQYGSKTYPIIFHILTHLTMEPDEAENSWRQVIRHRAQMSSALGREVGLRTAICDYFSFNGTSFKNHKFIDINIFEQTAKLSLYDGLTNLLNRSSFDKELHREISRARREESDLSLIFFDLDDFKKINDNYGHQAGDEVLKGCATVINRVKRKEDIAARYGGEELLILLPNTDKSKAMILAQRIRREIENMLMSQDGGSISVTVSGGIASFPVDVSDGESLISAADKAMYLAKSFGKNNICLYTARRRYNERYDYHSTVNFRPLGLGDRSEWSASSKDISVNGILFESSTPLELGETIELSILLNDDDRQLLLVGSVVRVVAVDIDKYDIGISFMKADQSVIKREILAHLPIPDVCNDDSLSFFCHH